MFEAPIRLSKSDIDQPAQALLTDDINVAVEVRLEELKHPAERHAPFRGAVADDDRDIRIAKPRAVVGAVVGKNQLQVILLARSNATDDAPDQRSDHGESARSAVRESTGYILACILPNAIDRHYICIHGSMGTLHDSRPRTNVTPCSQDRNPPPRHSLAERVSVWFVQQCLAACCDGSASGTNRVHTLSTQ